MIYDLIENMSHYQILSPGARDVLTGFCVSVHNIPPGIYELMGSAIRASVRVMNTHDPDPGKLEIHREYADLHLVTEGEEIIHYRPVKGLKLSKAYNPENDIAFFHSNPDEDTALQLLPGRFAVFLPGEGHRPDCGPDSNSIVKVMIKIHGSLLSESFKMNFEE